MGVRSVGSKGHMYTSMTKSAVRILTCILALADNSIIILASGLCAAELLGVLEEILDRR